MPAPDYVYRAVRARVQAGTTGIESVIHALAAGRPLDAEPDSERKLRRIQRVVGVPYEVAKALARGAPPSDLGLKGAQLRRARALSDATVDFLDVVFLEQGRAAADAVARLVFEDDEPAGTAFMISPDLLLTNCHVIEDEERAGELFAEFRFEVDENNVERATTRFRLNPGAFFLGSPEDELDYRVVALGTRTSGSLRKRDLGRCALRPRDEDILLGESVNLIQHPEDDHKQVVVRENRVVDKPEPPGTHLHYLADTDPGSSGSPVFDDEWKVVALHHEIVTVSLSPCECAPARPMAVGEGIRASAIIKDLVSQAGKLDTKPLALLRTALGDQLP